jgi:hypothetical protein
MIFNFLITIISSNPYQFFIIMRNLNSTVLTFKIAITIFESYNSSIKSVNDSFERFCLNYHRLFSKIRFKVLGCFNVNLRFN